MRTSETIAAFCTPPGGALSILRISGPDSLNILSKVWSASGRAVSREDPRRLTFGHLLREDGSPGETCLAVLMPAPHSYTGDDVVELQCHGGAVSTRSLLRRILRSGARMAEPGEFTKRAFLNGKIDLSQAEAVSDLILAKSESAVKLAERQLSGVLGKKIHAVSEDVYHLLSEIESRLDFPEENLDWTPVPQLVEKIAKIESRIAKLLDSRAASAILTGGVRLVIAGSPNVGKSSLMNLLLGYDRAIVSDLPGTTRDTLSEHVSLRGIAVELTDTAGIREDSSDRIEKLGIDRSKKSLELAQIVFWLFDSSAPSPELETAAMKRELPPRSRAIAVWNKCDLAPAEFVPPDAGFPSCRVSVLKNEGIETLLDLFEKAVWGKENSEIECAVSERHAGALEKALEFLKKASAETERESFELSAANLRGTVAALASITGESATPDVLDDIFSRFCIGK